jgi:hypothetical protein
MGGQMLFFSKNPRLASILLLLPFYLLLYTLKSRKLFIPMAIRKIVLFIGTFFLILFSFLACEKSTAPVENRTPQISLTVDEVAVTEVWLTMKTENLLAKDVLQVFRNDSIIYPGKPGAPDTNLYDSGLLPAHDYSYHASLIRNNQVISESKPQSITTMDTTSHEFSWTIDTIGIYGSVLYDVAMVDENDIWAVGEIHTPETDKYDSLGNWVPPFNAVYWGGLQWDLMRIKTNACGGVDYPPIKAILAFSHDDVLFGHTDGSITYYDGNNYTNDCSLITQLNGSANKMWGTSRNNLYVVDGNGFIAHHNSGGWQKIEILTGTAGTDLPIRDIWGSVNPVSGEQYILAPASLKYNWEVPALLKINPEGYSKEFLTVYNLLHSVWFKTPQKVYLCGGDVYYRRNNTWIKVAGLPEIFTNRIRGNDENDIWVVGDFGIALHYNGISWREYSDLRLYDGNWEGLAVKEDLVVAVGWKGESAIIIRGISSK